MNLGQFIFYVCVLYMLYVFFKIIYHIAEEHELEMKKAKQKKRFRKRFINHNCDIDYYEDYVWIDEQGKIWSMDYADNFYFYENKNRPTKTKFSSNSNNYHIHITSKIVK